MKLIPLSKGGFAKVSDKDYKELSKFKWYCDTSTGYARRTDYSQGKHKRRTVYMHKCIKHAPPGTEIDHKNLDKLDNRRSNLRVCSRSQNNANKSLQSNNVSGFMGVFWSSQKNKWHSNIYKHGKTIHLGFFINPIEAAKAYDKAARKYFGKFARTNF